MIKQIRTAPLQSWIQCQKRCRVVFYSKQTYTSSAHCSILGHCTHQLFPIKFSFPQEVPLGICNACHETLQCLFYSAFTPTRMLLQGFTPVRSNYIVPGDFLSLMEIQISQSVSQSYLISQSHLLYIFAIQILVCIYYLYSTYICVFLFEKCMKCVLYQIKRFNKKLI